MTTRNLRKVLFHDLGKETFAGFLRGARAACDLTQVEMAEILNVSKSTLCDIEKGRQLVSPILASKIAKKLKLSEKMAVQTAIQDQLIKANLSMKVKIVGT